MKTENNNRIPRNFKKITFLKNTGEVFEVIKDEWNQYIGTDIKTGKQYSMFISTLRIKEIYNILSIEM